MSKLIYSQTSTLIEGTYAGIKNRDQAVNPVYYSVAFTGDGFLYTHGRKFRLFNVVDDAVEGMLFQIQNGIAGFYIDGASLGTGSVIQAIQGDGVITATTTNGVTSLGHIEVLNEQQAVTYGSATQIPIITVNKGGHITSIYNSSTIDISKIRADATTATGQYHPVGVVDSNLQNPLYHNSFYFDGIGNIYAHDLYIGGNSISDIYAPKSHINVYATDQVYGHVILSDSANENQDVTSNIAATPKALYNAILTANQYSEDLFAAQDAMVFIGTLNADGVITAHNNAVVPDVIDNLSTLQSLDYKVGWTLRFITAGTYQNEDVEVGDMIIAVKKRGAEFDIHDWAIIQTNISGALTAVSNLNGLLYASGSRVVQALSLSSGILKYNGSSLEFVNPNTTWRDIQIDDNSIGTNVLNITSGTNISLTEQNGKVVVNADTSGIISSASYLNIEQGDIKFRYAPSNESTLTIGDLLSLTLTDNKYKLSHALGTKFSNKFGSITTDDYGHIIGITDVTTLPNPNSFKFKTNDGTIFFEYSGSQEKTLVFANGTDVSFQTSTNINDETVITPNITHKYRSVQIYPNADSASEIPILSSSVSTILTLIGGQNVSLSNLNSLGENLPDGTIMINAEDTWRDIQAYKFQSNLLGRSSIGSNALKFNDDFLYSNEELGIVWTEIDEDGKVTYVN